MEKTLKILASLFWIIGLAAAIIGLNIKTDAGRWISSAGYVTFLVGLALQGVVWALAARAKKSPAEAGPKDGETK